MRTHYCGDINSSLDGQEVTVAGWVHRRRDHGGVIFIDLRDRSGILQVVCDPDTAGPRHYCSRAARAFRLSHLESPAWTGPPKTFSFLPCRLYFGGRPLFNASA